MNSTFEPLEFVEQAAAANRYEPQMIVEIIRHEAKTADFGQLAASVEARIAELTDAAKARPEHARLNRGIETMRKVAELLAPADAQPELADLAERIKTCVKKSDNYAVTAGKHLREARERCRAIGLDFNKWCAAADLGIKRRRIYQLMGPDPIAAERRSKNHSSDAENVQSLHNEHSEPGELPLPEPPALTATSSQDQPAAEVEPQEQPTAEAERRTEELRETYTGVRAAVPEVQKLYLELAEQEQTYFRRWLKSQSKDQPAEPQPSSFDAWLDQFKRVYANLTHDQQLQVEHAMGDVEAEQRVQPVAAKRELENAEAA